MHVVIDARTATRPSPGIGHVQQQHCLRGGARGTAMGGWELVISVDVEEEGLFCGRYSRSPCGVHNVRQLSRLEWIPEEFGFPLTLLVTYPVACDAACRNILSSWKDHYQAEIGAHLHVWNTPPFADLHRPEPIHSAELPLPMLEAKLISLLEAIEKGLGVLPAAFRMGRFDFGSHVAGVMVRNGLRVDGSIVPLLRSPSWPDSFLSGADPYFIRPHASCDPPLLEIPLTQVPWCSHVPRWVHRMAHALLSPWDHCLLDAFRVVGALGIQPAWFSLPAMCWAVRRHGSQGGRVLHLFLHSSELMPGATPHFRTEASVKRLLRKMRLFLTWLMQTGPVKGATFSDILARAKTPASL